MTTNVGSAVELNESTSVNTRNQTMPTVATGDGAFLFLSTATGNTTFTVTDSGMTASFAAVGTAVTVSGLTSQVFKVTNLTSTDTGKTITIATSVSGVATVMKLSGGIRVVRGANLTNIVDTYATKTAGSTLTPSSPGVTTTAPGCSQFHFIAQSRGGTSPNTTTMTVNAGQGVTDDFGAYTTGSAALCSAAVAYDHTPLSTGAAIGAKIFTADQTAQYSAWTISLKPGNLPPVVDAGPNQVVASGATVTMAGTASDPDGTETHAWSFTVYASGSAPTLTSGTTLAPTWPAVTPGLYTLRLRSTDNSSPAGVTDAFVDVIVTTTTARVVAVTSAGTYTNVGGAASIPAALSDESTTTYAETASGPAGDALEVTFQPTPIGAKTLLYSLQCDSASPTVSAVVYLMQGATVIASWAEATLGTTRVDRTRILTSGQNAAITDPTTLSLRVVATQD